MRWVRRALYVSVVVVIAVFSVLTGCAQLQTRDSLVDLIKNRQCADSTPSDKSGQESNAVPRELSHVMLPPYVIEAPDVLTIEVTAKDPMTGSRSPLPQEPISGTFVVQTDGTVGLGRWGTVSVTGLKLTEASDAIRKHLASSPPAGLVADDLNVTVDVAAHNSKKYYVVVEAPDKTEQVHTFPITGAETVLEAITGVKGLSDVAKKRKICLKRRTDKPAQPWESLSVDWRAIVEDGDVRTNYFLQSGDRIYVTRK